MSFTHTRELIIFAVGILKNKKMKQNTKDWIQYISGASLIASAIVLAVTSLLQYERIAEGVNTYAGIAISGGLSVFGVAAYFVNQLSQFKTEIRNEIQNEIQNARDKEPENK